MTGRRILRCLPLTSWQRREDTQNRLSSREGLTEIGITSARYIQKEFLPVMAMFSLRICRGRNPSIPSMSSGRTNKKRMPTRSPFVENTISLSPANKTIHSRSVHWIWSSEQWLSCPHLHLSKNNQSKTVVGIIRWHTKLSKKVGNIHLRVTFSERHATVRKPYKIGKNHSVIDRLPKLPVKNRYASDYIKDISVSRVYLWSVSLTLRGSDLVNIVRRGISITATTEPVTHSLNCHVRNQSRCVAPALSKKYQKHSSVNAIFRCLANCTNAPITFQMGHPWLIINTMQDNGWVRPELTSPRPK